MEEGGREREGGGERERQVMNRVSLDDIRDMLATLARRP